ncbi:MAG: SDR family oxidoreductase [Candidatus Parcubacteria bacterium]|nr:SDR family oxidoreductase [Candidatus Parcubacteria bacterium]
MILITGSNGFVGRHLKLENSKPLHGDVLDVETMRPQFKGISVVVHLAAKEENCFETNVMGTFNVIKLCIENGCKLIYIGSIQTVYEYGISKQIAENLVKLYSKEGLKAVTIKACSLRDGTLGFYQLNKVLKEIENVIKKDRWDYRVITHYSLEDSLLLRLYRALKRRNLI